MDLDFRHWVKSVFDHEVSKPEWYWDLEAEHLTRSPAVTAAYVARLFEEPISALQQFSDGQVNQGLWYLVSNACSNIMVDVLQDPSISRPQRQRCIRAIRSLFEQCFAQRCSNHLSHLDEPGANPINLVCYMWWDLFPWWSNKSDPAQTELDELILDVMQGTLSLPCEACQESALHGLGHWHLAYPGKVKSIINWFLADCGGIREALREYAFDARAGRVQ